MKKKAQFGNAITYIILIVVSIIWIFPIIWIVLTSFRGESGQFVSYFIPHEFTADNYKVLFTNSDYPFLRWFGQYIYRSSILMYHQYIPDNVLWHMCCQG